MPCASFPSFNGSNGLSVKRERGRASGFANRDPPWTISNRVPCAPRVILHVQGACAILVAMCTVPIATHRRVVALPRGGYAADASSWKTWNGTDSQSLFSKERGAQYVHVTKLVK
jgi:hypothetical protein